MKKETKIAVKVVYFLSVQSKCEMTLAAVNEFKVDKICD